MFQLVDGHGRVRAILMTDEQGAPALLMYDENRRARAALMLGREGEPQLALREKDDKAHAFLLVTAEGRPHAQLDHGAGQIVLSIHENGDPFLAMKGGSRTVCLGPPDEVEETLNSGVPYFSHDEDL